MTIRGKLVTLRPIKMSDAPRYVKWFNDPMVNRFVALRGISLRDEKKAIRAMWKRKKSVILAIDACDGTHIGTVSIQDIHPQDKKAFCGIIIGDKRYWGKGYGAEAMQLLLGYGFEKLKLRRISLWVYSFNARAIRLYTKLGFKRAGILKKSVVYDGKWYDDILMSVTKKEFKSQL